MLVEKMDLKGRDRTSFVLGESIADWDKTAWLKVVTGRNEGEPDDVLANVHAMPIYSARLRAALDAAGITGIQYLPVRIYHRDGSLVDGYSIANILSLVPALDLERSDYSRFGDSLFVTPTTPDHAERISEIRTAVLRRSLLEGHDIIRLKELRLIVYVSEGFKEVFEANHFTGYGFREVELSCG
jgi:hypothetical protein